MLRSTMLPCTTPVLPYEFVMDLTGPGIWFQESGREAVGRYLAVCTYQHGNEFEGLRCKSSNGSKLFELLSGSKVRVQVQHVSLPRPTSLSPDKSSLDGIGYMVGAAK